MNWSLRKSLKFSPKLFGVRLNSVRVEPYFLTLIPSELFRRNFSMRRGVGVSVTVSEVIHLYKKIKLIKKRYVIN